MHFLALSNLCKVSHTLRMQIQEYQALLLPWMRWWRSGSWSGTCYERWWYLTGHPRSPDTMGLITYRILRTPKLHRPYLSKPVLLYLEEYYPTNAGTQKKNGNCNILQGGFLLCYTVLIDGIPRLSGLTWWHSCRSRCWLWPRWSCPSQYHYSGSNVAEEESKSHSLSH